MWLKDFLRGVVAGCFILLTSLTAFSLKEQLGTETIYPKRLARAPTPAIVLGATTNAPPIAKPPPIKNINILLLGLDGRKEDPNSRCDAIHMFSFKPAEGKILISSVPRGTTTSNGNIIANNCSLYSQIVAQKEIEKIVGIKADYVVKVGFSQAQGILRFVGLPASPTLQFLRDRKSYATGDNQRSYNQAVFFKDSIVSYTDWAAKMPEPIQRMLFNMMDTDLTFEEGKDIFNQVISSGIYKNPRNIEIIIKPKDNIKRAEIHFTPQDLDWQNDPEFKAYQNDVVGYLEAIIKTKNTTKIKLAVAKQLWLQVEDENKRNQLQSELLKLL